MDSRFFPKRPQLPLIDLKQQLIDAGLCETVTVSGIEAFDAFKSLGQAGPRDLSFFHNAKYADQLERCQAAGILVPKDLADKLPGRASFIPVSDVHHAMALAGRAFLLPRAFEPGIHPSAVIDPATKMDPNVMIGPFAVIEAGAEIGAGTRIAGHVHIGAGVVIGEDCQIDPSVTISHTLMGDRVHVKPGARIGQRGFGWALSPTGHTAKPQVGRVLIGHDVEIGANCAIDRGYIEDTEIGNGSVLDNLCHIAHNCKIGRYCALAATVAFAGSTTLGDYVRLGGGVAAKGHVHVADSTVAQAWTFIGRNTRPGEVLVGNPARSSKEYQRLLRAWSRTARGSKGS